MDNLSMKMYRECISNETGRGIGDDAQPYIDGRLISVADGAGARAYALQSQVNPLLFDRLHSFDTAMAGIIDPEDPRLDSYKAQYEENFFAEGYDLSRDYAGTQGRKSSYFGSRIASILIRRLLEDTCPDESLPALFQSLAAMDAKQRKEQLSAMGSAWADRLYQEMRRAAENCRLRFDETVAVSNVNLMCTTYSGILYHEEEDFIDTLTIQAGDSLPYALVMENTGNGRELVLKLMQPAQEGSDDGMINSIRSDEPFSLALTYRRLQKPCAIICASDGCFDAFTTPAHFEHYLMRELRAGLQCGDLEETAASMRKFFQSGITSDDSSTMAFLAFGFDQEMRVEMLRRQEVLRERMALDDAALYSENSPPEDMLKTCNAERDRALRTFTEEFWEKSPWIQAQYLHESAEELEAKRRETERRIAAADAALAEAQAELLSAVQYNWYYLQCKMSNHPSAGFQKYNPAISEWNAKGSACYSALRTMQNERGDTSFHARQQQYASLIQTFSPLGIAQERQNIQEERLGRLKKAREAFDACLDLCLMRCEELRQCEEERQAAMDQLCQEDDTLIRLYTLVLAGVLPKPCGRSQSEADLREYAQTAQAALNSQKDDAYTLAEIMDLLDELAQLPFDCLNSIQDIEPARLKAQKALDARKAAEKSEISHEKLNAARREFLDRPLRAIRECVDQHADSLPEDFSETLRQQLAPIEEKRRKYAEMAERKQRILAEYSRIFESFVTAEE